MIKKRYLILISFLLLLLPAITFGQTGLDLNIDYPSLGGVDPNVTQNAAAIIAWVYYFAIGLGAFLAVLVIAFGGFKYIMSFGNPAGAEEGKERITMAIFGFVLLLVAIVGLNTINPGIFRTFSQGLQLDQQILNVVEGNEPVTAWTCVNRDDLSDQLGCWESPTARRDCAVICSVLPGRTCARVGGC